MNNLGNQSSLGSESLSDQLAQTPESIRRTREAIQLSGQQGLSAPHSEAFLASLKKHGRIDYPGDPSIETIKFFLRAQGWRPVLHPQGRSYIEIVTNPESSDPKKEIWVKP